MAPPARKKTQNHNFMVKVLVPPMISATTYATESYQELVRKTMKNNKKKKARELTDVPDDLMESILERLSSTDRVRFGVTCKKNLSFVTTQQHQYQVRAVDKLSWMANFFCHSDDLVFRLFAPLQQRGQPNYADYHILDPNGEGFGYTTIKACKKGWFLCLGPKKGESGMTCFCLFCPFNKRIIKLPDLDHVFDDLSSCKATFSSDDPSSPDCVFFFLSQKSTLDEYKISTLDQKSQKWNTNLFGRLIGYVSYVLYHEGCFYCLSIQGELAAYDVVQQTWNLITAPSPLSNLHFRLPRLRLVAFEGKLIFAFIALANYDYNNLEAFRCGLFEFSSSTSTWVEKTSLGDHALFLGLPTAFTVPVPSSSDVADRMYFYSYITKEENCLIYYSLKDGRCHMIESGDYWSGFEHGMWIEPLPTF